MTIRGKRRWLLAANLLMAAGAAALVAAAAGTPLASRPQSMAGAGPTTRPDDAGSEAAVVAADDAKVWSRDLRKPLYNPKPVAAVAAKPPPPPPLRATLVGVVIEPGFGYALFKNSRGETKLVEIGQSVEEAELLAIREGGADVRYHGEVRTLKVEKR